MFEQGGCGHRKIGIGAKKIVISKGFRKSASLRRICMLEFVGQDFLGACNSQALQCKSEKYIILDLEP